MFMTLNINNVWADGKKRKKLNQIKKNDLAGIKFGGWRISLNLADAEKT